jgi:hypothetical protein
MEEYHVTSLQFLNNKQHAMTLLLINTIITIKINQGGYNLPMV